MGDIIRDGVLMGVTEFVIIITYIVVSGPVASMLTAIAAAGSDISQMASTHTIINTVFTICFILLGLFPLIWFVFRMMSREPDWGYRYY